MKITRGQRILLLGKRNYLVECRGRFDCEFGGINLDKLVGKKLGVKVKIGKERFVVARPTIADFLSKLAKRAPQVVLPKDAAVILAVTGAARGWRVVDAGTGSGFLAMFLAGYVGRVYTYEKREDFYKIAVQNIAASGLKNITAKFRDITKGIAEKDVDLVTLDLERPERIIPLAAKALRPGGWLAVFCLHVEEMQAVCKALRGFFTKPRIISCLWQEWQMQIGKQTWTRPRSIMLGHTTFILLARRL
jgi:tRNA (adenine57-N1/adenine58-N1)-methyltransferase